MLSSGIKFLSIARLSRPCSSGVLQRVNDWRHSPFYSSDVDLTAAAQLYLNSPLIVRSAVAADGQDITQMSQIAAKAQEALRSSTIFDRLELLHGLENIVENKTGTFTCLLGGKSTGKSKVLAHLQNKYPTRVIVANMRASSDLMDCLTMALTKHSEQQSTFASALYGTYTSFLDFWASKVGIKTSILFADTYTTALTERLFSMMDMHKDTVTLFIDEANIAFHGPPSASTEHLEKAKKGLTVLTMMTKEQQKINVVMVSSEYAYPFGLKEPLLNFNLLNLSPSLFAGEIPPAEMHPILKEWGVGENLAHALVDTHGGHLLDVCSAISDISLGQYYGIDAQLSAFVHDAIRACPDDQKEEMLNTLRLMATKGFAGMPSQYTDVAKILSEHNVGGVISRTSRLVVGFDRSLLSGANASSNDYALVPAKQAMRLAIAKVLLEVHQPASSVDADKPDPIVPASSVDADKPDPIVPASSVDVDKPGSIVPASSGEKQKAGT